MEIEIQPILDQSDSYETIEYANNKYYLTNYQDKELVIAYSKIGKVFSSLTATIMIESFGVEALLFTDVADGLQDLKVGDMIVLQLLQYNMMLISQLLVSHMVRFLFQKLRLQHQLGF